MNATTTAMQQALLKSDIAMPPLTKRLWLYIKDNPRVPASKMVPIFKKSEDTIRVTLRDMVLRNMLDVVKEPRNVKGPYGTTATRDILLYSTPARMKEYELLPMSPRAKKASAKVAKQTPAPLKDLQQASGSITYTAQAAPQAKPEASNYTSTVENMTLREARQLYEALHKLFGKA